MVEGRGSDPGPFEEPGDLGKEIELLVGHAGGDEKSHPFAFRGKTLEPIRRRLHGGIPFHGFFSPPAVMKGRVSRDGWL